MIGSIVSVAIGVLIGTTASNMVDAKELARRLRSAYEQRVWLRVWKAWAAKCDLANQED